MTFAKASFAGWCRRTVAATAATVPSAIRMSGPPPPVQRKPLAEARSVSRSIRTFTGMPSVRDIIHCVNALFRKSHWIDSGVSKSLPTSATCPQMPPSRSALTQDLIGKRIRAVDEKYYVADLGLRRAVIGGKIAKDIDIALENIVYAGQALASILLATKSFYSEILVHREGDLFEEDLLEHIKPSLRLKQVLLYHICGSKGADSMYYLNRFEPQASTAETSKALPTDGRALSIVQLPYGMRTTASQRLRQWIFAPPPFSETFIP